MMQLWAFLDLFILTSSKLLLRSGKNRVHPSPGTAFISLRKTHVGTREALLRRSFSPFMAPSPNLWRRYGLMEIFLPRVRNYIIRSNYIHVWTEISAIENVRASKAEAAICKGEMATAAAISAAEAAPAGKTSSPPSVLFQKVPSIRGFLVCEELHDQVETDGTVVAILRETSVYL